MAEGGNKCLVCLNFLTKIKGNMREKAKKKGEKR